MPTAIEKLANVSFGLLLAANMMWAVVWIKAVSFLPLEKRTREGYCVAIIQMAWRLALLFSPWVVCIADGNYDKECAAIMASMEESDAAARRKNVVAPPLFIMGNHTSFLDTILWTCKAPRPLMIRLRTYMSAGLFKLPVLSTICKCIGHFPVYFTSDTEGVFKVDNEKMEKVEEKVDEHLGNNGWLCFYPEGQQNKNPDSLMPFRFGGMKKALKFDARLACFVCYNNPKIWPLKAQVGGFPGTLVYSIKYIAPNGCKALAEELKAKAEPADKDKPDYELLAAYSQSLMQKQYDELKATKPTLVSMLVGWSVPLGVATVIAAVATQLSPVLVLR